MCEEKALPIIVRLDGLIEDVQRSGASAESRSLSRARDRSFHPSETTRPFGTTTVIIRILLIKSLKYTKDERGKILKAAIAEHKITSTRYTAIFVVIGGGAKRAERLAA